MAFCVPYPSEFVEKAEEIQYLMVCEKNINLFYEMWWVFERKWAFLNYWIFEEYYFETLCPQKTTLGWKNHLRHCL